MTKAAFLFLDECMYAPLDLAALTGVLIPLERYSVVRDAMCELVTKVSTAPEGTVPRPIELHAKNLLPGLGDTARLEVFETVTRVINENNLQVVRIAYLNRSELQPLMAGDSKLYGVNFANVLSWLQQHMKETLVIPVMDGVPGCEVDAKRPPHIDPTLIRAFAQQVRTIHHFRQSEVARRFLSIENTQNLGEPVFVDSEHSTLLQLVDLISHLLLQLERKELEPGFSPGPYKQAVLACAQCLRPELLNTWNGRMHMRNPEDLQPK